MSNAEQLVRTFIDTWNTRDYATLERLVSESYVMVDPASAEGDAHGAEGAKAWLKEIVGGFPDFQIEILDSLSGGGTVMVELKYTGTHRGEFNGIPPTKRHVELQGMEKHEVADGHLCRSQVYLDNQALRDQLGLSLPGVITQLPVLLCKKVLGSKPPET